MSYTKLEQFILLSLKDRYRESVANGYRNIVPAEGSVEELWRVVDEAYRPWGRVHTVDGGEIIEERILSVVGCTETDFRVALKVLLTEELIGFNDLAFEEVQNPEKRQPTDGHFRFLTPRGFRACREFESPV